VSIRPPPRPSLSLAANYHTVCHSLQLVLPGFPKTDLSIGSLTPLYRTGEATAHGFFDDTFEANGASHLFIRTNKDFTDTEQMSCAGYLEGTSLFQALEDASRFMVTFGLCCCLYLPTFPYLSSEVHSNDSFAQLFF
jgi:hypothetical protein